MHGLRAACRQLVAQPGFSLAVVLTLAIGIGFNTAVFSVVNALLFAPLEVTEPDGLLAIYSGEPGDFLPSSPLSSVDVDTIDRESRTFAHVAAYTYSPVAIEHGDENRLVLAARVTHDFFATLGVDMAFGRSLAPPRADGEVVLSHATWRRHFAANPDLPGLKVRIGGRRLSVVGVAPESFLGLSRGVTPEVWLALPEPLVGQATPAEREQRWLWSVGRLRPGATRQQAIEEVEQLGSRLARRFPASHEQRRFAALPLENVRVLPGLDSKIQTAGSLVMAIVSLVLFIACANVAQLLLVRGLDRRREMATHLALGADSRTIFQRLFTEGLLLAGLGGLVALAVTKVCNWALNGLDLPLPATPMLGLAVDGRVLLYTAVTVTVATLLASLAPALQAMRTDLVSALGGSKATQRSGLLGPGLVVGQVALSLVLIAAAGLMLRSLTTADQLDPGFDTERIAVATFAASGDDRSRQLLARSLTDRIRAIPDVEEAGLTSHLPLTIEIRFSRVGIEGEREPFSSWPHVDSAAVGPGYLETMGIQILAGRTFAETDDAATHDVVVNSAFARRFWPGRSALGRQLRLEEDGPRHRVIGIVGDGKYRTLGEANRPFLYRALGAPAPGGDSGGEITTGSLTLVARTRTAPETVLPRIRAELRSLDPQVAIARLESIEETLALALFLPRAGAVTFGLFALAGLTLACVGLTGVLRYGVQRRRREIGIRLALGADRAGLQWLIVRRALRLTLGGIAIGLVLVLVAGRGLAALLNGVGPADPISLFGAAAVLLAASLFACYLPALDQSGIDPAEALGSQD